MEWNKKEFMRQLATAAIIVVLFNCFFRLAIVKGDSMEPRFYDGNFVVISKMAKAHRSDIIVFRKDGSYLIKRVIGVGGDKVESADGKVYIDGICYGNADINHDGYIVPEGKYFVLGDNRLNSYDSRSFGFIDDYEGVVVEFGIRSARLLLMRMVKGFK